MSADSLPVHKVTMLDERERDLTHACEPHRNDVAGGWTNCHICFATIHVAGPPDGQCHVIVPWTGRCDKRFGHTGRHEINGIQFNV